MRIICLSNFYPPTGSGGYEEWCQEVTDRLYQRGHEVRVLTSRYHRQYAYKDPAWVYRELHLNMGMGSRGNGLRFFVGRKAREAENGAMLNRLIADFMPDVVFVWGMWNLSWQLPATAEQLLPGRVVYYIGDYWLTLPDQLMLYWQTPPRNWVTYVPKHLLRLLARWLMTRDKRPSLALVHTLFCTVFLQEAIAAQGIHLARPHVIYGAIDTNPYMLERRKQPLDGRAFSLLYVGRLRHDKGVHTAVEAVAHLVHQQGVKDVHLRIVGSGSPEFKTFLRHYVQEQRVEEYVTLMGKCPKEALPQLYHEADAFLFTSIWEEPFGRVLVEAMASGVAIIGTQTGGATEILVENENALTFPPGDAVALAQQIMRLRQAPDWVYRLAKNGRETALQKFDIERMTDEIEAYLRGMCNTI